jgi:hypothetical protein
MASYCPVLNDRVNAGKADYSFHGNQDVSTPKHCEIAQGLLGT